MSTSPMDYRKFAAGQENRIIKLFEYIDKNFSEASEETLVKSLAQMALMANNQDIEVFAAFNAYLLVQLKKERDLLKEVSKN